MGLITFELYRFEIRIQKFVFYYFYRLRTNYILLNNLNIKKTTGAKLSRIFIYIEAIHLPVVMVLLILFCVAVRSNIITVATNTL